jgi:hypothetical protein
VLRTKLGLRVRWSAGRDRERQRSFASVARGRQRRGEVAPPRDERSPSGTEPPQGGRAGVVERTEAGGCAVKRTPPGAGSSQDGLAPQVAAGSASFRRRQAVGEAQAARSGIRRSTGARIVSWLQKSVRSIFLARSRGAERRTEEARGSTQRRFSPRQGRITPRRAKGCEAEGRERQVSVKTHPSIARSGTWPAEGVLDQEAFAL